jgi:hypothetical protein
MASLTGSALDKLKASLAGQSAPANPATQADRSDPAESQLLDFQRIRRSCEVAKDHLPESDPRLLLIGGIHGAVSRLLSRVDLSDAADVLLESVFPLASPSLKAKVASMFAPISPLAGSGGGAALPGQAPGGQPGGNPTGPSPALGAGSPTPSGPGVPAGGGDMPPAV